MEKEATKKQLENNIAKTVGGDILVVDDNPASLELLLNLLNEKQYKVRVTTRGSLVTRAIRLSAPDLILLDINMPFLNGYQVCEELKADPATRHIPIIFISASDEVFDKVKAFNVGGIDYITKPFQFEEVLARIESQLKIAHLQKELENKATQLEKKTQLLETVNRDLAKSNEDLAKRNIELIQLYKKANLLFSAFSETLGGHNLDGKYQLIGQIGKGGNAVVYRALELKENSLVAIKIFRPNSNNVSPEVIRRLELEGLSAIRLNHPNVASVLDFGVAENCLPYIVMELLKGHTLKDEIDKQVMLSLPRSIEIVLPICQVLDKMHSIGILHRDIKPENIFLHQEEEKEIVKVLDFGIAKITSNEPMAELQQTTLTGNLVGTPAYISPERLLSLPYDTKTDIYSLGIVIYTMLTGRLPFEPLGEDFFSWVDIHLNAIPVSLRVFNPNIPQPIDDIVLRTLSKKPEFRPSALELAEELNKFL
ncbi:MAG: protein kinase [Acidobacteria bacterium]|nr:protein kinase [Acidobacteriota bacterium]